MPATAAGAAARAPTLSPTCSYHVSATTAGQLHLFQGTTFPSTAFNFAPEDLPSSYSGNFVAPFWSTDLFASTRGTIKTATFSDHVTIQWTDMYLNIAGVRDDVSHATFQAKLYTDGTIETAYCTMIAASPALETGIRATIGLQSRDLTRFTLYTRNEEGAVTTDRGLRFNLQP